MALSTRSPAVILGGGHTRANSSLSAHVRRVLFFVLCACATISRFGLIYVFSDPDAAVAAGAVLLLPTASSGAYRTTVPSHVELSRVDHPGRPRPPPTWSLIIRGTPADLNSYLIRCQRATRVLTAARAYQRE